MLIKILTVHDNEILNASLVFSFIVTFTINKTGAI